MPQEQQANQAEQTNGNQAAKESADASSSARADTPVDGAAELDSADIATLFDFDPFGKGADEGLPGDSEKQADGGTPPVAESTGETAQPSAKTTQAKDEGEAATEADKTKTPDPAPAAPVASPELEALKAQNAQLQAQLAAIQTQLAQGQAQGQGAEQGAADSQDGFQFDVPDSLMKLLSSEDPSEQRQGYQVLAQGVADAVYSKATGFVNDSVPNMIQQSQAAAEQARQVFDDFYGKYPALNKPELRNFVLSVGQQVFQETGAQAWTPEVRDIIGARAMGLLGQGNAQGNAAAPAQASTPPTPRMSQTNQARPPVPRQSEVEGQLNDLLFGGR